MDIDKDTAQAYLKELDAKRAQQQASIKQLESRLANKNYAQNAPKAVVEQTKHQLQAAQEFLATIDTEAQRFKR